MTSASRLNHPCGSGARGWAHVLHLLRSWIRLLVAGIHVIPVSLCLFQYRLTEQNFANLLFAYAHIAIVLVRSVSRPLNF